MNIRSMQPGDEAAMHDLHARSVREICAPPYQPEAIDAWLKGRTAEGYTKAAATGENFLVAEENGGIVAFASWEKKELVALFVHPAHSGKGIGKKLFAACEQAAVQQQQKLTYLEASLNAQT